MKNFAQNLADAASNLWDSLAVRVLAIGFAVSAVPVAFLFHVADSLAK